MGGKLLGLVRIHGMNTEWRLAFAYVEHPGPGDDWCNLLWQWNGSDQTIQAVFDRARCTDYEPLPSEPMCIGAANSTFAYMHDLVQCALINQTFKFHYCGGLKLSDLGEGSYLRRTDSTMPLCLGQGRSGYLNQSEGDSYNELDWVYCPDSI